MFLNKEDRERIFEDLNQIFKELTVLKQGDSAQLNRAYPALFSTFKEYITPENQEILATHNSIQEAAEQIDSVRTEIETLQSELNARKEQIEASSASIFEMEKRSTEYWTATERNSKRSEEAASLATSAEEDFQASLDYLNELKKRAEESKLSLLSVETAVKQVEDAKNRVEANSKSVRLLLDDIRTLHVKTIGENYKDEVSGEELRTEGLVDELEKAYSKIESSLGATQKSLDDLKVTKENEYEEIRKNWNRRFQEINARIESLLPGAVSAGLSQAYEKKTEEEKFDIIRLNRNFNWSILGLTLISALPVTLYIYLFLNAARTIEQIASLMPSVALAMLPVYIPCLWVAFSSSKKANLSKRLAEEYAHKASLSKTFEGISRQVSDTRDSELAGDLRSRLLYNLIQVSAENPGKLITDYEKSDHPLYQVLDKSKELSEVLEKISMLPGVDKLLSVVHERRRKNIAQVSDGILAQENIENNRFSKET